MSNVVPITDRRRHEHERDATTERFGTIAKREADHQDTLDDLDRARTLLATLDDADVYRRRARADLEAEYGEWIPSHLVDLAAARAAWADGHRGGDVS